MISLRLLQRWPAFLGALVAVCTVITSVAHAAELPVARIANVQFGFDGHMQTERWAPLRITIDAVQRPFSGTLTISYPQDHTQRALLHVPAAGTPGVATPIETVICLKRHADTVVITLVDERGRPVDRVRFGNTTEDPDAASLLFDQREGLVVCLGRVSPHRHIEPLELVPDPQDYSYAYGTFQNPSAARMTEIRAMRLGSLHTAEADPLSLPVNWAAYDTAEAIVLRSEELSDRISTASRQAIMQWVQGGGRLVLVVDQPGDLWRTWLPDGIASFITLGDPQRVPIPEGWQDVLAHPDRQAFSFATKASNATVPTNSTKPVPPSSATPDPDATSDALPGTSPDTSADSPSTLGGPLSISEKLKLYGAQFVAAETILARPITIAPQLRHSGWTTATPIDTTIVRLPAALQADEGETIRKTLPIMAHGPVGLGYVTILTADPSLAAANPSGETARRVWLAALAPGLEDYLSLPIVPAAAAYQQWGGWTGGTSGGNDMQSRAITQSLNALADQPGRNLDPITVLIALLACALLLTILLGPLDGLVLHAKRKMHMSWATALFWIVAVSVVAGFVPSFLRGNLPTMRITNVVDDVVIDHGGAAGWRTTLHGLFASQPGSRPLIAQPDAPTSGSAFRGVAVGEYWNTSTPIFTPIGLVQSSTLSSRGSEVSVWTLPISQGQWSFRNAMSIGPISTGEDRMPIRARAIRVDAYTLRIEVEGTPLPPPAVCTILSGEVRRSGSRTASSLDLLGTPGELSFTRTKSILDGTLPAYTESPVESTFPPLEYQFGNAQTERRPYGSFQDLPGIQRHELAIEARLATGRWALITLNCKIEIPTSSPGEEELQIQTRTFRLLVPIEGSATPPSDSGATP